MKRIFVSFCYRLRYNKFCILRGGFLVQMVSFKQNSKRFLALLFVVLIVCASMQVMTFPAHAAGKTSIIVHYHPSPNNTKDWNLWIWSDNLEGKAYVFNGSDEFGQTATYDFDKDYKQFGLIVRTEDWEKDIDDDRFIPIDNGKGEIWLVGGDKEVYTSAPDLSSNVSLNANPGEVIVGIHYLRPAGDYDHWYAAIHSKLQPVQYVPFTKDAFGATAQLLLTKMEHDKEITYSIIHATDPTKLGNVSLESIQYEMDGIEHSTSTWEPLNAVEHWHIQADPKYYDSIKTVPKKGEIVKTVLTDLNQVIIYSNGLPVGKSESMNDLSITANGETLKTSDVVTMLNPVNQAISQWTVTLDQPVDPSANLQVTIPGYGSADITLEQLAVGSLFTHNFIDSTGDYGANTNGSSTSFHLWAPTASSVDVVIYDREDASLGTHIPMTNAGHGSWKVIAPSVKAGALYSFEATIHGEIKKVADPFATELSAYGNKSIVSDKSSTRNVGDFSANDANENILSGSLKDWLADPKLIANVKQFTLTDAVSLHSSLALNRLHFANPYDSQTVQSTFEQLISQAHAQGTKVYLDLPLSMLEQSTVFSFNQIIPNTTANTSHILNWKQPIVQVLLKAITKQWIGSWKIDGLVLDGALEADPEFIKFMQAEAKKNNPNATIFIEAPKSTPIQPAPVVSNVDAKPVSAPLGTFGTIVLWMIIIGILVGIIWFTRRVVGEGHNPFIKK